MFNLCRYTLAIEAGTGALWVCGSVGRVGPSPAEQTPQLVPFLAGSRVEDVVSGDWHAAAVGAGRTTLFTWGRGKHGVLGHGGIGDEASPRLLACFGNGNPPRTVYAVTCGNESTAAVLSPVVMTVKEKAELSKLKFAAAAAAATTKTVSAAVGGGVGVGASSSDDDSARRRRNTTLQPLSSSRGNGGGGLRALGEEVALGRLSSSSTLGRLSSASATSSAAGAGAGVRAGAASRVRGTGMVAGEEAERIDYGGSRGRRRDADADEAALRRALGVASVGAVYKLNPFDPWLESARFQPLNLKSETLVSKFAFSHATRTATLRARCANGSGCGWR
jgi:hypothetical protein